MVRSLSGPAGKVDGNRYVIDDVRSRFAVPEDKTIVVYFEWEGPPGKYELSGIWKRPDGRVAEISPIQLDVTDRLFRAYWTNTLNDNAEEGVWQLEVRIDGEPAGSHPFEITVKNPTASIRSATPAPPPRRMPTTDELFNLRESLVWVRKLGTDGARLDTSTGFVFRNGQVATSFQSVDGASRLMIEFANGAKLETTELLAWNRLQDWALIKVDTGGRRALTVARSEVTPIGARLIAFNAETESIRVIGGVDVTARYRPAPFGDRLRLDPRPDRLATGGPLLNSYGEVVALLGGAVAPGFRPPDSPATDIPNTSFRFNEAAIPIGLLAENDGTDSTSLASLTAKGELTPLVRADLNVMNAGTTSDQMKNWTQTVGKVVEFRRSGRPITVFAIWQEREKRKGPQDAVISICDILNNRCSAAKPLRLKIRQDPTLTTFSVQPTLPLGQYRIDLQVNGTPVWRGLITIID